MTTAPQETLLLRIYLDKFQKRHHRPVYELVVEAARHAHLAGATVFEAIEGLGPRGQVLRPSPWGLLANAEIIVEIVDQKERIERFLESLEPVLHDAVVTCEPVEVVHVSASKEVKP